MIALRNAAVAGVGVCQLPVMMVRDQLTDGSLVRLLPDWAPSARNSSCGFFLAARLAARRQNAD
jgi:DNA-binding transcriptional LysR family regulator